MQQLEVIRQGHARPVDVALVTNSACAAESVQICINECQFGIGGTVVRRVSGRIKRFGGKWAFGFGTVVTALTQRPHLFTVSFDGGPPESHLLLGLVVANGAFTGGGMELVPGADTADGLLDVLFINHMTVFQRLRSLPLIYKGKHLQGEGYALRSCRQLSVETGADVDCEADGEFLHSGPRSIRVLPGAINVITPGGGAS
jgi:diacylglycerol kinase (ATP)